MIIEIASLDQDCEQCQWWKPAFERRMAALGLLNETKAVR